MAFEISVVRTEDFEFESQLSFELVIYGIYLVM